MGIHEELLGLAGSAREASRTLAKLSSDRKEGILLAIARALESRAEGILKANAEDLEAAKAGGLSGAMLDRLALTEGRLKEMADGVRTVAALPDPVGEVVKMWTRPNGLQVGRMRIPLGVIGIIYEARPNVTVDAAVLCIKSGNAVILRGGSEAFRSNMALVGCIQDVLEEWDLPRACVSMVSTTQREAVRELLHMEDYIDLIIPRGGEELIRTVVQESRIPVIKHYKGVCHIFVDASADMEMAQRICINAKVQRPGVCNAMETLLVHRAIASQFLPRVIKALQEEGVEIRGCERTCSIVPDIKEASDEDWGREFLDLILAVKVVDGLSEAITHIGRYGSDHTESIITSDYNNARRFLQEVNSSVVLVNASTRFSDGYQLGLGAEIGISTTKLHAYGPMSVEELTTTKFIVLGNGQIRE